MEGTTIRLLVVGDETAILDLEKLFFERSCGIQVEVTRSATEAMDTLQYTPYDAVISGYATPEIGGISFLKTVHARYPDIPSILFIEGCQEERLIEALKNDVGYYLQKCGDSEVQLVDLSHQIQQMTEQARAKKGLLAQRDLSLELSGMASLDDALEACLMTVIGVSGMDCGTMYLVDNDSGNVELVYATGLSSDFVETISRRKRNIVMSPMATGEPLYIRYQDVNMPLQDAREREGLRAMAVIPIRHQDKVIGYYSIGSHVADEIPHSCRCMLETVAATTGNAIARIQMEEGLRESERRYRSLYSMVRLMCDNVPDLIWSKDLDKKFIFANKSLCDKLLNVKDTDEPIGKTDIYFADRERKSHPDYDQWHTFGEISWDSDSIVMESRKAERFYEFGNVKGEYLLLDMYKAPFWDENEVMIGTVGCGRDVTKEKEVNDALKKSEERLRAIFEAAEDVSFVITDIQSPEPLVLDFSPGAEKIFGYRREEVVGTPVSRLYPPEDVARFAEAHMLAKRGNAGFSGEAPLVRRSGEVFPALFTTYPLLDEKGEVYAVLGVGIDISEQKKIENDLKMKTADLEAKNDEMEWFIYTVSHDLRSPLFTTQGFVGFLGEDIERGDLENVKIDLKMIENAIAKMDHFLRDTLELSRIGHMAEPPEDMPFGEIVLDTLNQTTEMIKLSGTKIALAKDWPVVCVDHMRIVEVLANLVENSIKYMGDQESPEIEIGWQTDGDETVFFVQDNGMGIDPAQHDNVFGLFYKLDKETDGTGAGLAIVKRIIEVHSGRIWIESERGNGCKVHFTLPT